MFQYLSNEVRDGLEAARKQALRRRSRMSVQVGDEVYPILRYWQNGFSIDASHTSHLRGLVDIYDGPRQMTQCLLVASTVEHGELVCEFKRNTTALDRAPLDFERAGERPVALLPHKF